MGRTQKGWSLLSVLTTAWLCPEFAVMLEPDPCCDLAQCARALAPIVAQLFGAIVDPALDQRNDRRSVLELGKAFDALGPQRLIPV